jgi:hypothetical protein
MNKSILLAAVVCAMAISPAFARWEATSRNSRSASDYIAGNPAVQILQHGYAADAGGGLYEYFTTYISGTSARDVIILNNLGDSRIQAIAQQLRDAYNNQKALKWFRNNSRDLTVNTVAWEGYATTYQYQVYAGDQIQMVIQ